ncbi:MAG: membrane-associated protein [Parcubacteria bacterium C7867-004]|nr:MAG: membrane-associated protein [Parcubacteria bacterium C7867-004]
MLDAIGISLPHLVQSAGLVGLFIIVFCESGMPFGFVFPGESLLFTAGFLASQGWFPIVPLVVVVTIAAILGDSAGYWLGSVLGKKYLGRPDSFFIKEKHVKRTEEFYEKYGVRAVVLARFIPAVRSFVPILAGIGSMQYRTFITYNVIGALLWGTGVTTLGYFLGRSFPQSEHYLLPIIGLIIVLSFLPLAFEYWNHRQDKKAEEAQKQGPASGS